MTLLIISSLLAASSVFILTPARSLPKRSRSWEVSDLIWPVGGAALAFLLAIPRPALVLILLPLMLTLSLMARSHFAKRQEVKRQERIEAELPTVVELLALAVSAGESPSSALARIAHTSHGEVGEAVKESVQLIASGSSLIRALDGVKSACRNPHVDRFIDAVVLGYERGTSLTEVLHAQALDVREQHRRTLIEHSARAEIAMMVPIVFLIMPVTILFALFPSLYSLTSAQ